MAQPTAHEALIYLMVVTSAADRDMTDVELACVSFRQLAGSRPKR